MAPVPPARFASLFRSLDSAERTTFVAQLWKARGWETTQEGTLVVATRDGGTRRIRVVDPGRFGTPRLDEVDLVVTTRDRESVREAAAAADVGYLPPSSVRKELLYGVDRDTAAKLFAETFDEPLDVDEQTTKSFGEQARSAASETWTSVRELTSGSRHLGLLLVVTMLVGVVVAGPAFAPANQANTTVPSVTYTPGEAGALGGSTATPTPQTPGITTDGVRRPAGLGEGSITNLSVLVDGHVDGVLRRSRTLRVSASGPTNATFMRGRQAWNYTARIENPRTYRFDGRFTFPASTFPPENDSSSDVVDVRGYADGTSKYRKVRTPNGTSYHQYPIETTGDASGYEFEVLHYLVTFLQGERSIVDCAGTLDSGDCLAYRIVISGAPDHLADAESYRAVAVVQDNGVIASLRVSYTLPDRDGDGDREAVRFEIAYDGFGETTVSEPAWLPEAKNATA